MSPVNAAVLQEQAACPLSHCPTSQLLQPSMLALPMCCMSVAPLLACRLGDRADSNQANKLDLDKERVVRTREEMAAEAAELRKLFS